MRERLEELRMKSIEVQIERLSLVYKGKMTVELIKDIMENLDVESLLETVGLRTMDVACEVIKGVMKECIAGDFEIEVTEKDRDKFEYIFYMDGIRIAAFEIEAE